MGRHRAGLLAKSKYELIILVILSCWDKCYKEQNAELNKLAGSANLVWVLSITQEI